MPARSGLDDAPSDLSAYADEWDHQAAADWLALQTGCLKGYEGEWVAFVGRG